MSGYRKYNGISTLTASLSSANSLLRIACISSYLRNRSWSLCTSSLCCLFTHCTSWSSIRSLSMACCPWLWTAPCSWEVTSLCLSYRESVASNRCATCAVNTFWTLCVSISRAVIVSSMHASSWLMMFIPVTSLALTVFDSSAILSASRLKKPMSGCRVSRVAASAGSNLPRILSIHWIQFLLMVLMDSTRLLARVL